MEEVKEAEKHLEETIINQSSVTLKVGEIMISSSENSLTDLMNCVSWLFENKAVSEYLKYNKQFFNPNYI